jgi:hypothetical protein
MRGRYQRNPTSSIAEVVAVEPLAAMDTLKFAR